MRKFSMLLAGIVVATPALASDQTAFMDRVDRLPHAAARAALELLKCTDAAAKTVAERHKHTPTILWPVEEQAKEAVAQCGDAQAALAAALPPRKAEHISGSVQRISATAIERTRKGEHYLIMCAGAWELCTMKPVPLWKQ